MPTMFQTSIQRKAAFLLILTVALFQFSCKKETVELSLAQQVEGTYNAVSIDIGGTVVPMPITDSQTKLDVSFIITSKTDNTMDVEQVLTQTTNGVATKDSELQSGLVLIKKTDGSISLMNGNVEFGSVTSNKFKLVTEFNGLSTVFMAVKI
jgi:hypothetical protein